MRSPQLKHTKEFYIMQTKIVPNQTQQAKSPEIWANSLKYQQELEETGFTYVETEALSGFRGKM